MIKPPSERERHAVNMRVLKSYEPSLVEIRTTASYVVIYSKEKTTSEWEKEEYEGTLFLIIRNMGLHPQLFLLNRLSMDNFIVDITSTTKVSKQSPYLLLHGVKDIGIWFHDPSQLDTFYQQIILMVRQRATVSPAVQQPFHSPMGYLDQYVRG